MNIANKTWCVPSSVLCALIYGIHEQRPVRIAITAIDDHTDHAQAQVQGEDGSWYWLTERWNGDCVEAMLYRENHPNTIGKEPHTYYTVREFLGQQAEVLGLGDWL